MNLRGGYMSDSKAEMIFSITDLIIKHGIPTAMNIIKTWNTGEEPTIEEIRALRYALPDPESFFKG